MADVRRQGQAIAAVLTILARKGDMAAANPGRASFVQGIDKHVRVKDMVSVWLRWATHVEAVATVAAIYIDRACTNTGAQLCSANVNGYLLAALVLATKWCDDRATRSSAQQRYAFVFGVPIKTINAMERDLLADLRWELHVDSATYDAYMSGFEALLKKRGGGGTALNDKPTSAVDCTWGGR